MDIYKQVIPNKVLKFKNSNFKKYTKIYGIFSVGGGLEGLPYQIIYVPQTTEDRAFFRKLFTGGLFVVYPL